MQKLRGCQELRSLVCPAGDLPAQESRQGSSEELLGSASVPGGSVSLRHCLHNCPGCVYIFPF